MTQPDIVLGEQKMTVIDQIDVALDEDSKPNIELTPNSAPVRLGGGDDQFSSGELLLADEDGNIRFWATGDGTLTLGDQAKRHVSSRALIDGNSGNLELGADGLEYGEGVEYSDIKLTPNSASLRLGGGGGDYSEGDIKLCDRDGNTRIHLTGGKGDDFDTTRVGIDGDDARVDVGEISIRGNSPSIDVGQGDTTGRIWVNSSSDDGSGILRLYGGAPPHKDPLAGTWASGCTVMPQVRFSAGRDRKGRYTSGMATRIGMSPMRREPPSRTCSRPPNASK